MTADQQKQQQWMRWATYASVAVASILIVAKLIAWLFTESASLLATLADSCLDVAASMINLLAVRQALQPADAGHRFGHGKAESLAGLGQAVFIAGSAGFIVLNALRDLLHPRAIASAELGIGVMLFSIALTMGLIAFQRFVVKETGSTAIAADSAHYLSDVLVNLSVIVALLLAVYGWSGFDAIFAMGIAVFIFYSAWDIGKTALQTLMDHELPDEDRQNIERLACQHPEVHQIHDLRTRRSGVDVFVQMHIELDDHLSLLQAHAICDAVEQNVQAAYPRAEVLIHADPRSLVEEHASG